MIACVTGQYRLCILLHIKVKSRFHFLPFEYLFVGNYSFLPSLFLSS